MLKVIVGLGNPGSRYAATRHNCGFFAVEQIARQLSVDFDKKEHDCLTAAANFAGQRLVLAKPQSFMNLSGFPVQSLLAYYKVDIDDLLVIFDDMDLLCGEVRLRRGGSSGGHNGIASVLEQLGSQQVARIKIGIGHPLYGEGVDFVLGKFTDEEKPLIEAAAQRAAEAALLWLKEGMTVAMDRYNIKKKTEEDQAENK